jgi:3-oxoacyl-[acyl-carrier protein] reductase
VVVGYHNDSYQYIEDIEYVKCDVTNSLEIDSVIKNMKNRYGKIDIIINLSCLCMDNSFLNKTKDEFMRVLEVNLVGTFLVNQIYSRYMDNGLIINMGSTDGIDTYNEYNMDYAVSKSGIIYLSKMIASYTSNKVLCLCPNWVDTKSTRSMNTDYLNSELKRINQDRLISIFELENAIDEILNSEFNSGDCFRIDIKRSKLWIEKI